MEEKTRFMGTFLPDPDKKSAKGNQNCNNPYCSLYFRCFRINCRDQQRRITGKVTDKTGESSDWCLCCSKRNHNRNRY